MGNLRFVNYLQDVGQFSIKSKAKLAPPAAAAADGSQIMVRPPSCCVCVAQGRRLTTCFSVSDRVQWRCDSGSTRLQTRRVVPRLDPRRPNQARASGRRITQSYVRPRRPKCAQDAPPSACDQSVWAATVQSSGANSMPPANTHDDQYNRVGSCSCSCGRWLGQAGIRGAWVATFRGVPHRLQQPALRVYAHIRDQSGRPLARHEPAASACERHMRRLPALDAHRAGPLTCVSSGQLQCATVQGPAMSSFPPVL